MSDDFDIIAIHDQVQAEVMQKARVIAGYHKQLVTEGIDDYEAMRLTLAFQRRFLFPDAPADPLDPDAD